MCPDLSPDMRTLRGQVSDPSFLPSFFPSSFLPQIDRGWQTHDPTKMHQRERTHSDGQSTLAAFWNSVMGCFSATETVRISG